MRLETEAIVCATRPHGEHGAVVRALTAEAGLIGGYVRGGGSRRLRPALIPGNVVRGDWRARTDEQLPALAVELIASRAPLLGQPAAACALDWVTALTATALPEGLAYPRLHAALDGLLTVMALAPTGDDWLAPLIRYEWLLLAELGFGLDVSACAMGGAGPPAYVSPRTGAAVSEGVGRPYADRLMRLPAFLLDGTRASGADVDAGFRLTGFFLERDVLDGRTAAVLASRGRLIDRVRPPMAMRPAL